MDAVATVQEISELKQITDDFSKVTVLVKEVAKYPQELPIDFPGDKSDLLSEINVGDKVKVSFNIKSKRYMDKNGNPNFFVYLQAWHIAKVA